jgi:hypothetical protein
MAAVVPNASRQELVPGDVAPRLHRALFLALEDDHLLDGVLSARECVVDDGLQVDGLALPPGDVAGEDGLGARHADAVTERAGAEAGEHDGVDGADPDDGQQEDDGLRRRGHVHGDPVALADVHPPQGGGHPFDLPEELPVGVSAALAQLVDADQGGVARPAVGHVVVEAVPAQVRLGAAEPLERGRRPVEDAVPLLEPRQALGFLRPEPVRVDPGLLLHAAHHRVHDVHGSPFDLHAARRLRTLELTNQIPVAKTATARPTPAYTPVFDPPPPDPPPADPPAARFWSSAIGTHSVIPSMEPRRSPIR